MSHPAGFIKLLRTEKTEKLLFENPLAYIVLSAIAFRAKRANASSTPGLKKGEALIGYTDLQGAGNFPGLTRQNYRTALANLQANHLITIKTTHKGTIAKLISTDIYDVNEESDNQQDNHRVTDPVATNKKYRRNKNLKEKKEKKESANASLSPKKTSAERITPEKLEEYKQQHPNLNIPHLLAQCEDYCDSKGQIIKDWNARFRNWIRKHLEFYPQQAKPIQQAQATPIDKHKVPTDKSFVLNYCKEVELPNRPPMLVGDTFVEFENKNIHFGTQDFKNIFMKELANVKASGYAK